LEPQRFDVLMLPCGFHAVIGRWKVAYCPRLSSVRRTSKRQMKTATPFQCFHVLRTMESYALPPTFECSQLVGIIASHPLNCTGQVSKFTECSLYAPNDSRGDYRKKTPGTLQPPGVIIKKRQVLVFNNLSDCC